MHSGCTETPRSTCDNGKMTEKKMNGRFVKANHSTDRSLARSLFSLLPSSPHHTRDREGRILISNGLLWNDSLLLSDDDD